MTGKCHFFKISIFFPHSKMNKFFKQIDNQNRKQPLNVFTKNTQQTKNTNQKKKAQKIIIQWSLEMKNEFEELNDIKLENKNAEKTPGYICF